MKKLPLFGLFFILLFVASVFGQMPNTHTVIDAQAIRTVSSEITNRCDEQVLIAGEKVTDIWVTEYTKADRNAYIGSHSIVSVINGFRRASDVTEQCLTHGQAMHLIVDYYTAHGPAGIVPSHLKKFFGSNVLWHGIVEQGFERDLFDYMIRNPNRFVLTPDETRQITASSLDIYFEDQDKFDFIKEKEGKDPTFSLSIVDQALKVSNGNTDVWFDTVYSTSLPLWWILICVGLISLGILLLVLTFILKVRTGEISLFSIVFGLIFLAFGILLLISILTGQSFLWYQTITGSPWLIGALVSIVGAIFLIGAVVKRTNISYWILGVSILLLGLYALISLNINFSDAQIESVLTDANNKLTEYLETEKLDVTEASGLSYCAKHFPGGACEEMQLGALNEAEGPFIIVLYIFSGLLGLFIIFQIIKVVKGGK